MCQRQNDHLALGLLFLKGDCSLHFLSRYSMHGVVFAFIDLCTSHMPNVDHCRPSPFGSLLSFQTCIMFGMIFINCFFDYIIAIFTKNY